MDQKNSSKLSQHKFTKGILKTPFNDALGNNLTTSSWAKNRLPEYLWLGLILFRYGRAQGLEKVGRILKRINEDIIEFSAPKLSIILSFENEIQKKIYDCISKETNEIILSPLTAIYLNNEQPILHKYFYSSIVSFTEKLEIIETCINKFYPHQSEDATDLRFSVISSLGFSGKLSINSSLTDTISALNNYAYTNHDAEEMRSYRPTIRAMEGNCSNTTENNNNFILDFWRRISMKMPCKTFAITFDQAEESYDDYLEKYRKKLEKILAYNKEAVVSSSKFEVLSGLVTYALKIFAEITENNLGNKVLGRHAIRSIVETYISFKHILQKSKGDQEIWDKFKQYGIGKYKFSLLKLRETQENLPTHIKPELLDILVNENTWEEFTDIDLRYFDSGIKKKCEEIGEENLYGTFYEYDTNYIHSMWGAIRESAMLKCDSSSHQYHVVSDVCNAQNLPNVVPDAIMIMNKLFDLLEKEYFQD